jgi:quercetin dioxygenase-like cupin family protein
VSIANDTRDWQLVDGAAMPWVNGAQAAASMVPEFRDHLGPPEPVARMLEQYWMRALLVDEATTRRIDHVRCDPGYRDASTAFHRSAEECLVLDGSLCLDGEGPLSRGDYFWRPPGFIHSASSEEGFEAILMMEGMSAGDASGPTSREIRPLSEAGENALHPDDPIAAIGPRGWPRRVESGLLARGPVPDGTLPAESRARCLSVNPWTQAGSYLVDVPAGARSAGGDAEDRERILVLLAGELEIAGHTLDPDALVRIAAGARAPAIRAHTQAQVLLKLGGRQGREHPPVGV